MDKKVKTGLPLVEIMKYLVELCDSVLQKINDLADVMKKNSSGVVTQCCCKYDDASSSTPPLPLSTDPSDSELPDDDTAVNVGLPADAGDVDAGDADAGDADAGDADDGDADAGDVDGDAGDVDGGDVDAGDADVADESDELVDPIFATSDGLTEDDDWDTEDDLNADTLVAILADKME